MQHSFFLILLLSLIGTVTLSAQTADAQLEYEVAVLNPESFEKYNHIYDYELKHIFEAPELTDAAAFNAPLTVFCPVLEGNYPLVIICHGWRVTKKPNASLARYLASQGYIAAILSAKRKYYPEEFLDSFEAAYKLLKKANKNIDSYLFNRIDIQNTAIIGHSMGGTAALHFAQDNPNISSVIALNPYNRAPFFVEWVAGKNEVLGTDLSTLETPVLIFTGSSDKVAYPESTFEFYRKCNTSAPAAFLAVKGGVHTSPLDSSGNVLSGWYDRKLYMRYRFLILGWLDLFLKQKISEASMPYLQPAAFETIKAWFYSGNPKQYPAYTFRNFLRR